MIINFFCKLYESGIVYIAYNSDELEYAMIQGEFITFQEVLNCEDIPGGKEYDFIEDIEKIDPIICREVLFNSSFFRSENFDVEIVVSYMMLKLEEDHDKYYEYLDVISDFISANLSNNLCLFDLLIEDHHKFAIELFDKLSIKNLQSANLDHVIEPWANMDFIEAIYEAGRGDLIEKLLVSRCLDEFIYQLPIYEIFAKPMTIYAIKDNNIELIKTMLTGYNFSHETKTELLKIAKDHGGEIYKCSEIGYDVHKNIDERLSEQNNELFQEECEIIPDSISLIGNQDV